MTYVLEHHQVIDEKDALGLEDLPHRLASLRLRARQRRRPVDVTVLVGDQRRPMIRLTKKKIIHIPVCSLSLRFLRMGALMQYSVHARAVLLCMI